MCRLSPNSEILDSSELYKVSQSVSSVLFVGGTYYTKSLQNVKEDFKRDYHENTREKSYSLEVYSYSIFTCDRKSFRDASPKWDWGKLVDSRGWEFLLKCFWCCLRLVRLDFEKRWRNVWKRWKRKVKNICYWKWYDQCAEIVPYIVYISLSI